VCIIIERPAGIVVLLLLLSLYGMTIHHQTGAARIVLLVVKRNHEYLPAATGVAFSAPASPTQRLDVHNTMAHSLDRLRYSAI
jgi:hypothetical protein